MSGSALALREVAVRLGTRDVLAGVSLELAAGEILTLAGPNGAGKTTLFRVVSRVLPATRGHVTLAGRPLASFSRRDLAREIAVVPQDVGLAFPFSAAEVVLMGRAPHLSATGFEGRHDVEVARAAMQRVGVLALADRPMPQLSGGERQLVLFARALAQEARVLLLDEPTSHLDLRHRAAVAAQVARFAAEGGAALVVSHDLTLAARSSHRLALLADGRLLAAGPPREVLTPALLRRAYGIDATVLDAPDGAPLVLPGAPEAETPLR